MELKRLNARKHNIFDFWIALILIVLILAGSAYFRVSGLFWGEYAYLHPDERFLIDVTTRLQPVEDMVEYFNTGASSLNPHNLGISLYVYGDFPIIVTRYVSQYLAEDVTWDLVLRVGRALSVFFDLGCVLLIYLIGKRFFNVKIGVLAALFSGAAVLQIQQAHFYTVDTFGSFFAMLAVYLAVVIYQTGFSNPAPYRERTGASSFRVTQPALMLYSALFGLTVGLAAASKINTVFVAILLPLAYGLLWLRYPQYDPVSKFEIITRDLIIGGVVAVLAFRIFQPYAFAGPGFFNFGLNPKWLANISELSRLASGDVDYPPALQWARRSLLFAPANITLWGLGIPLSVPMWLGMLLMGWKILRKEWKYALIWVWTVAYFLWQASVGNPMMRYQLPIYPLFALLAAWFIFQMIDFTHRNISMQRLIKAGGYLLGIAAVGGGLLWATMFTHIYVVPITRIAATQWIYENVPGPVNLMIDRGQGIEQEVLSLPYDTRIQDGNPYPMHFSLENGGRVEEITFARLLVLDRISPGDGFLSVTISEFGENIQPLAQGSLQAQFREQGNTGKGVGYSIKLDSPVEIVPGRTYQIMLSYSGYGSLMVNGSAVAIETSWDDPLPARMYGKDAYSGIYQDGLNFEMYWNDDEAKLNRFYETLNATEYIFISSNRQWGTTTRVPERYPLTTQYYRSLLGCPEESEVLWCYNVARPGMFTGDMGFELIKVFESYPTIGNFSINDQFAEEAFSVYDHPKVLIFKKTAEYNPDQVRALLSQVDLSKVLQVTPARAPDYPATLELPADRLAENRAGGTWSELFDRDELINTYPILAILLWYFSITFFGWLIYPITRMMLHGLADKGYAFSKLCGILILALIVWFAGSNEIAVTRMMILTAVVILAASGIIFGLIQRKEIAADLAKLKKQFLVIELLSLLLFGLFLLIRFGNPDLWHTDKGGEKPMDFAYLNAVIKSSSFPPYDPWYAGGYINYYYYGFVISGIWVKLLGIIPSVAYNLILALQFSIMGTAAYGIGWNLLALRKKDKDGQSPESSSLRQILKSEAFTGGILSVVFVLIIGNFGTVRMMWQAFQKLGATAGSIDSGNLFERLVWAVKGIGEFVGGAGLPLYPGDWYWVASRALPKSPITEFPFFTFLYADLHAHLMALPLTLLVIGWALSVIGSKWKFKGVFKPLTYKIMVIMLGAVTIGALRPTNTWDFPTYLLLGLIALVYTIARYRAEALSQNWRYAGSAKLWEMGIAALSLAGLAFLLYQPFSDWFGQAYSAIDLWKGDKSPFWSYFTHWGFFLTMIVSWFAAETVDWMATTPLSSLRRLRKYRFHAFLFAVAVLLLMIVLLLLKVVIGWLAVLLAVWAFILILRNDQSDAERFVLFLTGTALVLTLFVEVFVLRGDIERMNTVFKFYLQAWNMLAVSAAFGGVWLIMQLRSRAETLFIKTWVFAIVLLFSCVSLYPLFATAEKVGHRIDRRAPVTLDGMEYMRTSFYTDEGVTMELDQDYQAFQWMQDHITGSPVIVEANTVEYRWGSRYSIYTGLPGVVGWNWHQRQQRAVVPSYWVTDRVNEVNQFYRTLDGVEAQAFLKKYDVKYIVVGQLERALYPGEGLDKFEELDGIAWQEVFRVKDTVIYEVLE